MDMADRIFIATLLTLALFVLVLERRNRILDPQLIPARPGMRNVNSLNVPHHRAGTRIIDDVAYMDVSSAADAGQEGDADRDGI